MKKRINSKIIFASILLVTSVMIYPIKLKEMRTKTIKNDLAIKYYIEKTTDELKEEKPIKQIKEKAYDYIAILEIPSINLKQGLVSKYSKYNDVKYNIQILSRNMPDKERTNFILASHNGSSSVSYFNNLSKMHKNDIINIYYNGIKYIYKYYHSYEVLKTGEINIERDKTISTITLITCKENDDNHQVVYLGYLINTETY